MFGDIVAIVRSQTGQIIKTARWRDRGLENYIEHLGGINLTLVNDDPIAYGERTMNLPSMGEITSKFIPSDSTPKFTPPYVFNMKLDIDKSIKDEDTVMKVLGELNSEKLSSAEIKNGLIDTSKCFLLNDGETTFVRSYIKYEYIGDTLAKGLGLKNPATMIAKRESASVLSIDNSKLLKPENTPPEFTDLPIFEMRPEDLESIYNATTFTSEIKWKDHKAYVPRYQLYFPWKHYFEKQLKGNYEEKGGSKKYVMISDIVYKVLDRTQTYSTQFSYRIKYKDYDIRITQITDWINLEYEKEE